MELKDFLSITTQLAQNHTNQALVTELLTKLNDDYTMESTNKTALAEQSTTLSQQVDKLKEQNMNLFLRVGNPVPDKIIQQDTPVTYEDLLKNEFGVTE